jgi:hypothetical protein
MYISPDLSSPQFLIYLRMFTMYCLRYIKKKKTMTCDVRKLGPGLGQKQKCGGVEPVNEIPTLLS